MSSYPLSQGSVNFINFCHRSINVMTRSQVKVKVSVIIVRTMSNVLYFTLSVTYYANTGCIVSNVMS